MQSKNRADGIEETVITAIKEQIGENEVKLTDSFIDDLGCDSLDMVEMVMTLEENFDIDIPDEDAGNITTVQEAVDYVAKKIGSKTQDAGSGNVSP